MTNPLTRMAIWVGSISWLPRYLPQITAVDRLLQRLTGGRWSLLRLAGLPNLMLILRGRKSGVLRQTPLLCVPYRGGQLIAGSNFGGPKPPVWVGNVRASTLVQYRIKGQVRDAVPRELSGADREQAWAHMLRTWPNYAKYAERADRVIPVFHLDPVG